VTLKVLSYNIWEGGDGRLPAIAAIIQRQQPDAVALQEATSRASASALARELGYALTFGEANNAFHIAWLSRQPPRRWQNHRLSGLAKTLLEIELSWRNGALRLFATHLGSRHDRPQPTEEVQIILAVLRPLAGAPHLLVGDFNALHPDDSMGTPPPGVEPRGDAAAGAPRRAIGALLEAGYLDCYRALHPHEPGYTYPAASPWLRLDYIFASPLLAAHLIAGEIVTGADVAAASDHVPIWAEFREPARRHPSQRWPASGH
jgi:endonuclease/exonuclease/phosphatase family metal-dependent hydrolase